MTKEDFDPASARTTPVPLTKCVWCKHDTPHGHTLSTGETICEQCLGDLREWNRTRFVDLLVSSELESSTQSILLDKWREVRDLLARIHEGDPKLKALPSRISNNDSDDSGRPNNDSGRESDS